MNPGRSNLGADPVVTAVDMLRGGLAIMVLVAHAVESAQVRHHAPPGASPWVAMTLGQGGYWVQGFFVLSGFCIHQSLMGLRRRSNEWTRTYVLARFSRLYPVYGVSLVLALAAWGMLGPTVPDQLPNAFGTWAGHLFMMQGITGSIHEIKPAWSLTYEAAYYAAWPLLLVACGWRVTRAGCLGCAGALLISCAVAVVWKTTAGGAANSMLVPLVMIPAQFLVWVAGALLAHRWEQAASRWFPLLGWMSAAGLLTSYLGQGWLTQHGARQWMLLMTEYATIPFWLGLLVGVSRWRTAARWSRLAAVLGWLSYPLYILHQVLLDVMVRELTFMRTWGGEALMLATVALAMVLAFGVPLEILTLRWRAAWLRGQRAKMRPVVLDGGTPA